MKALLFLLFTTLSIEAKRVPQRQDEFPSLRESLKRPGSPMEIDSTGPLYRPKLPPYDHGDYKYPKSPKSPKIDGHRKISIEEEERRQMSSGSTSPARHCDISIDYGKGDLQEPQPLLLTNRAQPEFLLPNEKQLLIIPANTSILLACPGRNNSLENLGEKKYIKAMCLHNKQFLVNRNIYEFKTFKCKFLPKEAIKRTSKCLKNHQIYSFSFMIGKVMIPLLEICRDEHTFRTYYSIAYLNKEIDGYQHHFPRPYWKYKPFYPGYNMNYIYKKESQLQSMELLLGSKELANKYIRHDDKLFLNRGHLVAKADFIYGSQQKSTFWHMNTAVQWSSFNSGNWMILENNVRTLAGTRKMNLIIYTGVHGITNLTDVNGNQQPMYLHVNETHKAFEVPRFFWKIIHDPDTNLATAFVGVNEPFAKTITDDMFLCPDISGDKAFSWLTWRPKDIIRGVSYACAVGELKKAVPTVPHIGETGILV